MDFQKAKEFILSFSVKDIKESIKNGKLDLLVVCKKTGRTLAMIPSLIYEKYEVLVSSGCRIDTLDKGKLFPFTNLCNLDEYLKNQKLKGLAPITIDCSIKNKYDLGLIELYGTDGQPSLLLDQNLINFNDKVRSHIRKSWCAPRFKPSAELLAKLDSVPNTSLNSSKVKNSESVDFETTLMFIRINPVGLIRKMFNDKYLNPLIRDPEGNTLLGYGLSSSNITENTKDITDEDEFAKDTSVIQTSENDELDKFRLLVEYGCPIVTLDNEQEFVNVPLLPYYLTKINENIEEYIKEGLKYDDLFITIDMSIKNRRGQHFLYSYSTSSALDIDEYLSNLLRQIFGNMPANIIEIINQKDEDGLTILHAICYQEPTVSNICKLLDLGADPTIISRDGRTPVEYLGTLGSRSERDCKFILLTKMYAIGADAELQEVSNLNSRVSRNMVELQSTIKSLEEQLLSSNKLLDSSNKLLETANKKLADIRDLLIEPSLIK